MYLCCYVNVLPTTINLTASRLISLKILKEIAGLDLCEKVRVFEAASLR